MISVEKAKSGQGVLKKNGRFLGSSYDPVKEAMDWAEKASVGLGAEDRVFVLGIGSGHHVLALTRLRPLGSVITIECDAEVARLALEICPDLERENVVVEPDWLALITAPRIQGTVCGVYRIAKHGPSLQCEPDYFKQVENLLIGRDRTSFLLHLKTRPDLLALLDPEALESLGKETIGIKTLQKLFAKSSLHKDERRLWRVLEELVV